MVVMFMGSVVRILLGEGELLSETAVLGIIMKCNGALGSILL